jgi:hypothetical protein
MMQREEPSTSRAIERRLMSPSIQLRKPRTSRDVFSEISNPWRTAEGTFAHRRAEFAQRRMQVLR